ncbi:hypothetical protein HSB1_40770 [Halogranum salarium B-1]|uniref:Uncharacterized protein n=1 Tax=Halogranum salarium B-1 TaxID=1210908 RepID=J3JDR4_9EURY|nr:hypothetical protein HSB1_40770 [Halogranum salarium B-1]
MPFGLVPARTDRSRRDVHLDLQNIVVHDATQTMDSSSEVGCYRFVQSLSLWCS